ncbi:uncharacterized protein prrt4a, partial [Austrofundulus limnaeus]|uniref:Uncharacterized protein prrt4a n=1 Tax=Austrofundulus limnaeus TaxID=52670 RepID=A0A2I4BJ74_AUSLI
MGFLRTIFLLHPFFLALLRHVTALNGENASETQQADTDRVTPFLTQSSYEPHGSSVTQEKPMFGPENVNVQGQPLSWTLMSSEDTDRQGVLGEYSEESTEAPFSYLDEGLLSKHIKTEVATSSVQASRSSSGPVPQNPIQEQIRNLSAEIRIVSVLQPTQSEENEPTSIPLQEQVTESHLPLLLSGLVPPHKPEQKSSPSESDVPKPNPEGYAPSAGTDGWPKGMSVSKGEKQNGLDDVTDILHRGIISTATDGSRKDSLNVSKTSGTFLPGASMDMISTPCKTSAETWTPTYPDDLTPSEPLRPFLILNPGLLVPLYTDWNSALSTWGFAWEAHIYGLGAVFSLFGLTSVVCLLGLSIRCPPGFPFFTMLHFFILSFAGIQAFCLVYDAYNSQDRLPPLVTQMLSELPLPCLISAFSLAFLLLSLNSRNHLSLPLAIAPALLFQLWIQTLL